MKQPLSSPARRLALTELKEDEKTKAEALTKFRAWLDDNPHISCRRDNSFLLRFLRSRKYRIEEAQEQLRAYLKMRAAHPRWFSKLDVRDPVLAALIDGGYYFALPERDREGRRVFFNKTAALDTSVHTNSDQMRTMALCFESMLEDEENQVRGFTYILDEKDVGFSYISMWSISEVTKAIQCCEKTIPMRHKEVHFLNLSTTFSAIFEFVKTLISDKMTGRIQVHANLEALHEIVDPKILPKEYGGVVPMATMISLYREEAEAVRESVVSLDAMSVGKPPSSNNRLQRTIGKVQRSFKKLEID